MGVVIQLNSIQPGSVVLQPSRDLASLQYPLETVWPIERLLDQETIGAGERLKTVGLESGQYPAQLLEGNGRVRS